MPTKLSSVDLDKKNRPLMKPFILLVLTVSVACATAMAQNPEHGRVVGVRAGVPTANVRYSLEYPSHVYRIETQKRFYELMDKSKKPTLAPNESVEFRIEKETAYVVVGKKEKKFNVINVEEKPLPN